MQAPSGLSSKEDEIFLQKSKLLKINDRTVVQTNPDIGIHLYPAQELGRHSASVSHINPLHTTTRIATESPRALSFAGSGHEWSTVTPTGSGQMASPRPNEPYSGSV